MQICSVKFAGLRQCSWFGLSGSVELDVCTHRSYDASCRWRPRLLCDSREDLKSPPLGLTSASSSTFRRQLKTPLFTRSYPDIPTAFDAHDEPFSSYAAKSFFLFDVVRRPCSHFDITPSRSVTWWMNEWMNEWMNKWMNEWINK